MKVTLVGTGVAIPTLERRSPSLLVEEGSARMLLDIGPGTLRSILRYGTSFRDLTHIALTHFHPDHSLDIVSFFLTMAVEKPAREVAIMGPEGLSDFLTGVINCFDLERHVDRSMVRFVEIGEDRVREAPFVFSAMKVFHTERSVAYRVELDNGRVLAYSGDTGMCEGVVEAARGADLLVLECSFPDDQAIGMHMTPERAATVTRASGAKKVVLTHFYPAWDPVDMRSEIARAFGDIPFIIGEDGMSLRI